MESKSQRFFDEPTKPVHKQLARLETDGVIVGHPVGQVRVYELNPRDPFIQPLKELLKTAISAYPSDLISRLMVERTSPRQPGKPAVAV